MFPSSIFNSSTVSIASIPKTYYFSILFAFGIFALSELSARYLLEPLGTYSWMYWDSDARNKFEYYREVSESEHAPQIVAVGDSTAARNFNPKSFHRASGSSYVYNLSWPANFPMAFRVTTLPLLGHSPHLKFVFLFFSPKSFVDDPRVKRFEKSILSSPLGQRARGQVAPADYLYLSRLYSSRKDLIAYWLLGKRIVSPPAESGFMPMPALETASDAKERQSNLVFKADALVDSRIHVIEELSDIARLNGFVTIVVIPPWGSEKPPELFHSYRVWLNSNKARLSLVVWDIESDLHLNRELFVDDLHLTRHGADVLSEYLGRRFASEFCPSTSCTRRDLDHR